MKARRSPPDWWLKKHRKYREVSSPVVAQKKAADFGFYDRPDWLDEVRRVAAEKGILVVPALTEVQ